MLNTFCSNLKSRLLSAKEKHSVWKVGLCMHFVTYRVGLNQQDGEFIDQWVT